MAHEPTGQVFEVHLAGDVADELGLETPVETDRINFYDSGLWFTTDAGRDFFPYEHVLSIRERPAPQPIAAGGAADPESTDDDL